MTRQAWLAETAHQIAKVNKIDAMQAEDKSNDWREEIAQLEVIEERLDA